MKPLSLTAVLLLTGILIRAKEPMIIAHRGASKDAPENTIPAFKLAWKQGADGIEGDFRQTSDGEIVCIHDANTGRVADRDLAVADSSLAALRDLDVGAHAGERFRGTMIPTIAEVFATVPSQKKIYIEIKCDKSVIPKLLEEIKESGLKKEQITVISFDKDVIRAMNKSAPEHKELWLCEFSKDLLRRRKPSLQDVLRTLEDINADGLSTNTRHVDEALVQRIVDKGFEYHVWTVDDVKTARRFRKWGAASITTNVPGRLLERVSDQNSR